MNRRSGLNDKIKWMEIQIGYNTLGSLFAGDVSLYINLFDYFGEMLE